MLAPDAMQRAAVHRRAGAVPDAERVKVPVLRLTTSLRCVLRRARDKFPFKWIGL